MIYALYLLKFLMEIILSNFKALKEELIKDLSMNQKSIVVNKSEHNDISSKILKDTTDGIHPVSSLYYFEKKISQPGDK